MERASPCKPLMASSWGFIVNVIYAKVLESYVKIVDTLVHSVRLVCSDTDVKEVVVVVD